MYSSITQGLKFDDNGRCKQGRWLTVSAAVNTHCNGSFDATLCLHLSVGDGIGFVVVRTPNAPIQGFYAF